MRGAAIITWSRALLVALCMALATRPEALADSLALPLPVRVEVLDSTKVGESREFWVALPDRYFQTADRYPVVYMMDGDFNFNSGVIGGLRYAAQLGDIPDFIVVGIKNTNRSRDIFPQEIVYGDGSRDGGRANQYLDFIRDELIPYVEKAYRTERFRVLYGTSNTGFTTVYALFRNPEMADAYVAASATLAVPAFQDDLERRVREFGGGTRQLLLVTGEYDLPTIHSLNGALEELIGSTAPAGLTCRLSIIRNGEHVPAESLLSGLRDLFAGWKITQRLSAASFSEIRAQVDGRLTKFGVPGRLPEDGLRDLGATLLREKKHAKAIEVLLYRAESYPDSAEAQISLGEAYQQAGNPLKARDCYRRALSLAPGDPAATTKLRELER